MTIEVTEEAMTALAEYARVPMIFRVDRVLDVTNRSDSAEGFALSERRLAVPYEKDYDAIPGEGPLQWAHRVDLSKWALFTARVTTNIVGGAIVAFDTPGLTMLEGHRDPCRFYERQGCRRHAINHAVYPQLPEEIQLLWYKDLLR